VTDAGRKWRGNQNGPTPKSSPEAARSSEATKPRQQNKTIVLNELVSGFVSVPACVTTFEIAFIAISTS
jgi:hypothetical protein